MSELSNTNMRETHENTEATEVKAPKETTEEQIDDELSKELDGAYDAYTQEKTDDDSDSDTIEVEEDDDEEDDTDDQDSDAQEELSNELNDTVDAFESGVASETDITDRRIPGTPGKVTGGSSYVLGCNMLKDMGVTERVKWGNSGYQAHHIIPKECRDHPVLQKIGMRLDDASNGIFLRKPNDGINTKTIHFGNHKEYSDAIKRYLDSLDVNDSVEALEDKVADLQQQLKKSLENGTPIYKSKPRPEGSKEHRSPTYREVGGGATADMWDEVIKKLFK